MEQGPLTAPLPEPGRVNILVVDDQLAKLLSYEVVLAEIGENLIKASSAYEAFECLLKNEIALILIDVCMPDVDGFELAALIRQHPRFQQIAIIFVSAVITEELPRLRGYELGALDYVPVPVVPELLRAKVQVFVDLYRKTRHLKRFNVELERRVVEQSAELRRCNEELEKRIEARTREREAILAQTIEAQRRETIGQLAEVTHDFNNLLMAVLGNLALLDRHLPEDPYSRHLLHNATEGARRGAALTRSLLSFSRRQERKARFVDVRELINGLEELLRHALGVGIELIIRLPHELPPAFVDANQLELALLNVALNARDAMSAGGRLLISASGEIEFASSSSSSLPSGESVRIKIAHDGVETDANRRPAETAPLLSAGAEAGLTAVQRLVIQSGWFLSVLSTPEAGTALELWLPRTRSRSVGDRMGN
jgi:signal transduction histidine kinase